VKKELDERFGEAEWVLALEDPSVYLNDKVIAERKLDHEAVEDAAARALVRVPGVLRCYTRAALLRGLGSTAIDHSYQLVFYPPRSGDVLILVKPYSFWGKYAEVDYGDSHGTPYSYDTHVPLALFGPDIVPGLLREPVSIADLAPTLAALLQVNPPPSAEGRILPGVLRAKAGANR
jgi:hypothetical protein